MANVHFTPHKRNMHGRFACGMERRGRKGVGVPSINQVTCKRCQRTLVFRAVAKWRDS